jgi:alpha-L-rhamnosidase
MTSFNHYALGAVADWLHRTVGGLAPAEPGYRRLNIQPHPGGGLTHARARHHTPYGLAESAWKIEDGQITVEVVIPPNTTARVILPGSESAPIGVEAGAHRWSYPYQISGTRSSLSLGSTVGELLDNPVAWEAVQKVILRVVPELAHASGAIGQQGFGSMPLRQLIAMFPHADTLSADIEAVLANLGHE